MPPADYVPDSFDHRTANSAGILARARLLEGRTVGDIVNRSALGRVSDAHSKGGVGAAIEAYFGIPANSSPEPDFVGARVELKTVPVRLAGRDTAVKERTVIGQIDYHALALEEWPTAHIRAKLDHILFVYYDWAPDVDLYALRVRKVVLWQPSGSQLPFLERDWLVVRDQVRRGEAHLISEGEGRILGAATKSATSADRRTQPASTELAKPRAWALKQSFTRALLIEATTAVNVESLIASLNVSRAEGLEASVIRHYSQFVGQSIGRVATTTGAEPTAAKHSVALVLRKALGQRRPTRRIKEFEELGIEIKMVRAGADARPYESMSFPGFRYGDLVEETWEESDLLAHLNRFLILPIEGPKGLPHSDECIVRRPFFWTPSQEQLTGIGEEWEMFRGAIARGHALSLTPASATRYIHVRPKARNSADTDVAPIVGPVVKKCFWLNRSFVQELLLSNEPDWGDRARSCRARA